MTWFKIGVIIPSSNTTVEREFNRAIREPEATIHSSRIMLREVTLKGLEEMERETERAALELSTISPDIIAYACTTGSLFKGPNHHVEIKERIERLTKVKAVATAGAVVDAIKKLNASKVLVVTPYIDELNTKEKEFLEAHGFKVVNIRGLGIVDNTVIGSLDPRTAYETALNAYNQSGPDFDVLFISCTNWRTFEVIGAIERRINKPVVSSNSATLWSVLKELGLRVKLNYDLGMLFSDIQ
ncbi:maleate cis-trans isomerase family protein [Vulcanisaeta souniana]|uniref:Maleate cis-trans isomerase n=1 Tax=Vulcanisaeta souniana JCM 11219 TaxID=1293586 RepID=A0A830E5Y2_9CREN|nr:aspartate/glutamate racemase family protein [Vulcanisaeta souniana]BDR91461.1 maleate cis-trans isomerase [Vulcanisaeta souniana JCM 11219]GGI73354.1 maleate cis-trans isomerase [Vulcanisaeta souniana JCM 11219]